VTAVTTNLVISGGPLHDFTESTRALVEILATEGVHSTVFDDPRVALHALSRRPDDWDVVTVNALHWKAAAERHADLRERWAFDLGRTESETIDRYVRNGGGLLACHTAVICFDGDPRWAACLGATWSWDRSMHPPLGPVRIGATPAGRSHPITDGIHEFELVDEVYGFLDAAPDLVPLLTSPHNETDHPVLWARSVGAGRVVTDLLGHDATSMDHPIHREILRRAVRWLIDDRIETAP
jgi:type 1 glutamine amidotransferase